MKEIHGFCFVFVYKHNALMGKKCYALKSRLIVKMEMNKTVTWILCTKTMYEVFAVTLPVPCVFYIE